MGTALELAGVIPKPFDPMTLSADMARSAGVVRRSEETRTWRADRRIRTRPDRARRVRSIGHHARAVNLDRAARLADALAVGRRRLGWTTPSGRRPPSSPTSWSARPAPSAFPAPRSWPAELERFFADGAFDDPDAAGARAQSGSSGRPAAEPDLAASRAPAEDLSAAGSSWARPATARGAPVQQPGGEHPADGAAEVGLPADPGRSGQHAPDQPAVDQQHDHGEHHLTGPAGPQAAGQQVGRASRRSGRWRRG